MPTHTFKRAEHKAFIEGLSQGTPASIWSAANKAAIEAYTIGFLFPVVVRFVDSYTIRTRSGNRIETINVMYTV